MLNKTRLTIGLFTLLFFCMVLSPVTGRTQTTRISLNSASPRIVWEIKPQADLKNSGYEISMPGFKVPDYIKGIVPGTVFTAYVHAGIVPDRDYADNIYKVDESFFNRPFWYRTEFELPATYVKGQRLWLHFDNTNRFADFYFNGTKLSGTKTSTKDVSGHMLRTKYDVTDLIKRAGKNAVAVLITDADQKKKRNSKESFGVTASPTYLSAASWDWMPYVPGRLAGITGNAYIEITGDVTMEDPWIRSQLESNDIAYLYISSTVNNASASKKEATISGVIQPGNIRFSKKIDLEAGAASKIYMDRKDFSQLLINNPKLWWPNGYGEPNLYTCKLTCSIGNIVSDVKEITFGIKKYEYQFVKNAAGWPVMTFFINGQKYVANDDDFKANALDKVKRLRNHPSIALWCGANETHPKPALDNYLRAIVAQEDHNDRMYKSSSNQDGLSGSGWWGNQPPKHHFETSGSNLAWNKPPYPYGSDRGYGLRSEIGTATFPTFESVKKFIPAGQLWPLPSDEALKKSDTTVWNRHYFGKEASNANPLNYKAAVNKQFGESAGLEDFCEKAKYVNIEVMKGMYEAWNDKMGHDASGLLIWMSQSAYPSFVWQTYDYYYDATGAYWGAKKACEPLHIQWNASNNSIKAVNTTSKDLNGATAKAAIYNINGKELTQFGKEARVNVPAGNIAEVFTLDLNGEKRSGEELTPLHFIKLELKDAAGNLLSENFYWRNGINDLDYTGLNTLPPANLSCRLAHKESVGGTGKLKVLVKNNSNTVAFGNRLRLVNKTTQERVLPVIMSDNYFTLMPGEEKLVTIDADVKLLKGGVHVLQKQYGQGEKNKFSADF